MWFCGKLAGWLGVLIAGTSSEHCEKGTRIAQHLGGKKFDHMQEPKRNYRKVVSKFFCFSWHV